MCDCGETAYCLDASIGLHREEGNTIFYGVAFGAKSYSTQDLADLVTALTRALKYIRAARGETAKDAAASPDAGSSGNQ